jgi:hypothetical protein
MPSKGGSGGVGAGGKQKGNKTGKSSNKATGKKVQPENR